MILKKVVPAALAAGMLIFTSGTSLAQAVDPQNDPVIRALHVLESKGYRDFREVTPVGRYLEISAVKDGKPVRVRVDPDNRQIESEM
jgi:hypothetical protein